MKISENGFECNWYEWPFVLFLSTLAIVIGGASAVIIVALMVVIVAFIFVLIGISEVCTWVADIFRYKRIKKEYDEWVAKVDNRDEKLEDMFKRSNDEPSSK